MLVAVTGASGMLGGHIVEHLVQHGHSVRGLTRRVGGRDLRADGVDWVEGGLDDRAALDRLVAGTDAIVHAAYSPIEAPPPEGRSAAEQLIQTNLGGTVRLIERTPSTRLGQLVYVSSLAVYGTASHLEPAAQRVPIDEDYPVWPGEFYGGHKAALERLVIAGAGQLGLNTAAFRIGCVFGHYPDLARDHLATVAREAVEFGEIRTRVGAYAITAGDAAALLCGAVGDADARGRVFNTFDRWIDFSSAAEPLSRILGREIRVACEPAPEPQPPIRNDRIRARMPAWSTEAALEPLLAELVARIRSGE
ncbi:MAG: NAD(P)-dependent oxidoreductase [Planctomycetes bacterium]|nr:NAD(P)-dependent oxidoreductase [Planctomycetota bacterium]